MAWQENPAMASAQSQVTLIGFQDYTSPKAFEVSYIGARRGMIHVCADEAGKFGRSRTISFAGWVAYQEKWEAFGEKWFDLMKKYRIRSIHTTSLMSRNPAEYQGRQFSAEEKIGLLKASLELMHQYAGMVIACAVDCQSFKAMPARFRRKHGKHPHVFCFDKFIECLFECMENVSQHVGQLPPVTMVFDDNPEYAARCYTMFSKRRYNDPRWKTRFRSICFTDDALYPGVQMADIMVWLVNQKLRACIPMKHELQLDKIEELVEAGTQGLGNAWRLYDSEELRKLSDKQ